jgi:hypothetical protein
MRVVRRSLALVVVAAATAAPTAAQGPPAQQISVDPLTDTLGQHETAVEPDSFSFGNTVVAAYQIGRTRTAGASAIGWATSPRRRLDLVLGSAALAQRPRFA